MVEEEEEEALEPATLPASATTADPALVDRVAEQVRDILLKTVSRGMDRVGQLLLRELFDDTPALYTSGSHAKHASLRLLLERCGTMDLPVRRTFPATRSAASPHSPSQPRPRDSRSDCPAP